MTTALRQLPRADVTGPYRRPTWPEALVGYLPPDRRGPRAFRWVERLPTLVVLLATALLALRLRNSAFIDEALYVNAGQDYLNHLLHGSPVPPHGSYLSGAPIGYPVLAAALDSVGGLQLVRLSSLLFVLVGVVLVQETSQHLFASRRAGLLAGAVFGLTGAVVFLGALATFDALCVMLLALALWLGVTRAGPRSAVLAGAVLAGAVALKYTVAVFVPVVLVAVLLAGADGRRRAAVAAAVVAVVLPTGYLLVGESLLPGIRFTTSARAALSPTPQSQLLVYLALDLGGATFCALWGLRRCVVERRSRLLAIVLLAGAGLLPAAQLRLGEAVSFDKHTAFSALFLAPLAGVGLAALSRGLLKLVPVLFLVVGLLVQGMSVSSSMYAGWPPLGPVLELINEHGRPGLYVSSSTDALKYYTRRSDPDVRWQTTFALYSGGDEQIRQAIEDDRFEMVIIRRGSTGSTTQDRGQQVLEQALQANRRYVLVRPPFPVQQHSRDAWLVYRLDRSAGGTPKIPTGDGSSGPGTPLSEEDP